MRTANHATWHKVLGIICAVFGAGAAVIAISRKVISKFSERQMEVTGVDPAAYRALLEEWSGPLAAITAATCVAALVLLVGGILLLMKKRSSAVVLRSWAGLKILVLLGTIPVTAAFQKASAELAFAGALAGEGAELAAATGRVALVANLAGAILWGLGLPVFVLVWFSRRRIREQVAFWN